MLTFIRALAITGTIAFSALLLVVFQHPDLFKRSAIGFAKQQIEAELREQLPSFSAQSTSDRLKNLAAKLGKQQVDLTEKIQNGLPQLIAAEISKHCRCDVQRKKQEEEIAGTVSNIMKVQIKALENAQNQLSEIIKGKFDTIISALKIDVVIFLTSNLVAFVSIFGATFVRNSKGPMLIYPALILFVAVSVSSYIFVFETNWFYAVLFQDYWGYSYLTLQLVIFSLLADIAINRARVLSWFVSFLPHPLVPTC